MTEQNEELGTIRRANDCFEAQLVRFLECDQIRLWEWLTEPERTVEWLAPGEIAHHAGGRAKLNFSDSGTVIDSTVTTFEPPRCLEYSWSSPGEPSRPIRWETAPEGGGTRLTLLLRIPATEDIARACAGWEAHLQMLLAAIEGVPIKFPFERFKETRAAYKTLLG